MRHSFSASRPRSASPSATAEPQRRQKSVVPVKVVIESPLAATDGTSLKPEMAARVLFLAKPMTGKLERVILIPKTAVRSADRNPRVLLFKDERATAKPVVLGVAQGDQIRVLEGLTEGDVIILNPAPIIWDGRKVKIKED